MNGSGAEAGRVAVALCLAALLHAVLMLPDFDWPVPAPAEQRPLDVMLVRAAADASGARSVPAEPASPPAPATRAEKPAAAAPPESRTPARDPAQRDRPSAAPAPEPRPAEPDPAASKPAESNTAASKPAEPEPAAPSAAELRTASLRAAASVGKTPGGADDGVRRKYVRAGNADWRYAGYIRAWVAKIERVGRMNYPEQAVRDGLSGDLLMSVGIAADGSLESIELRRSSGYPLLDQAAKRIVRLCAPFAPLPEEITEETDVLYITRNWKFLPHGELQ